MLSTAYIAHYNAPAFYNELEHPTMEKFNKVVGSAFGTSILFFISIAKMILRTPQQTTQGVTTSTCQCRSVHRRRPR
jgi:amino acid permease